MFPLTLLDGSNLTITRQELCDSIQGIMEFWGPKKIQSVFQAAPTVVMKVELKHFVEDVYSALNYSAILSYIPKHEHAMSFTGATIKDIYPALDADSWFAYRIITVKGEAAPLRNVAAHRYLPRLNELQSGLACYKAWNADKSLDVTVLSTFCAVTQEVSHLFSKDTVDRWMRG